MARDVGPAVAAIGRTPEAALLAAADQCVRVALRLPGGRVEDLGVGGVERQVVAAGAVALVEDLFPALAAIPRAEDAALLVAAPGVT
jgi:hypothetical protein